jgi:2-succinyl-5-enolpyruvyl-6-hydroxy-3-cyclohexene-1-carboxylate synthase
MDMFAATDGPNVPVEYNRGASGIDGTIATAVGYANALHRTVTLIIGDLAFLHDLNSLELVRRSKYPLVIFVINNDGGGIFSFLPIADADIEFEKFFGTPHGLTLQKSAEQFGLEYSCPNTIGELTKAYSDSRMQMRSTIIEISTKRRSNLILHQKISKAIQSAIERA